MHRSIVHASLAVLLPCLAVAPVGDAEDGPGRSAIRTTEAGELVLVHVVEIAAPREEVWEAYTTGAGWQRWAAPVAEVDLRVGGSIRTHYDPTAEIGPRARTRCTS